MRRLTVGTGRFEPRWPRKVLLPFAVVTLVGSVAPDPEPADWLRDLADRFRKEVAAPGAIVGIRHPNGQTEIVAVGKADIAQDKPMTAGMTFYVGSVTKTHTAATVLRLAERGLLSLDDRLSAFLPGFPRGDEITVRHLLEQTSGLRDFYSWFYYRPDRDDMIRQVTRQWTEPELIALSSRFGHAFQPGSGWDYSSTNYYLLGVIAERAASAPLAEVYRRVLYEPLTLHNTWLPKLERPAGELPTGYMGPVRGWKHSEMFGNLGPTTQLDESTAERSAGGLAASAKDALAFLGNLMEGRFLKAETLGGMMPSRPILPLGDFDGTPATAKTDGYGQGLARMRVGERELIGHGGLYNGHSAGLWYIPSCKLTLVVYANRGLVNMRRALDAWVRTVAARMESSC
jgi:D-alanyl-D-alanine carboxypeptidase